MANWVQEGTAFSLIEGTKRVVCVRPDRETDSSATGWQAYARSERLSLDRVGFFRRLKDAMQHVMVLHKLEE